MAITPNKAAIEAAGLEYVEPTEIVRDTGPKALNLLAQAVVDITAKARTDAEIVEIVRAAGITGTGSEALTDEQIMDAVRAAGVTTLKGDPGPKGDKGDVGPKGDPGPSGGPIPAGGTPGQYPTPLVGGGYGWVDAGGGSGGIVSPGRPDMTSSLDPDVQAQVAAATVGTDFYSTDGAGVGAWVWRKRPTGWVVTDGDTGFRDLGVTVKIRRIGDVIYLRTDDINSTSGTLPVLPTDWRPWPEISYYSIRGGTTDTNILRISGDGRLSIQGTVANARYDVSWSVTSSWPTTLPGSPS